MATKLGIILLFLSSSFQVLFSQKGFTYDFEFLHAFLSNLVRAEYVRTNVVRALADEVATKLGIQVFANVRYRLSDYYTRFSVFFG